jgi:hypothetical protein
MDPTEDTAGTLQTLRQYEQSVSFFDSSCVHCAITPLVGSHTDASTICTIIGLHIACGHQRLQSYPALAQAYLYARDAQVLLLSMPALVH